MLYDSRIYNCYHCLFISVNVLLLLLVNKVYTDRAQTRVD